MPADSEAAACIGSALGDPLTPPLTITGAYNPAGDHYGVDYRAADGTNVLAMTEGVIERVGNDVQTLSKPNRRSGKMVRGWGIYIILRHGDGSQSLYAHLQSDGTLRAVGDTVMKGDIIAHSDTSGGASGPHLHVEYAPNGNIYSKANKVDPTSCIGLTSESITVGDNGNIADDSFEVYVDGVHICTSPEGGTEKCQISGIKSGTHELSFVCNVAPDDEGTWFIQLGDGVTFSTGGTYATGVVPEGGGGSFGILVP